MHKANDAFIIAPVPSSPSQQNRRNAASQRTIVHLLMLSLSPLLHYPIILNSFILDRFVQLKTMSPTIISYLLEVPIKIRILYKLNEHISWSSSSDYKRSR